MATEIEDAIEKLPPGQIHDEDRQPKLRKVQSAPAFLQLEKWIAPPNSTIVE